MTLLDMNRGGGGGVPSNEATATTLRRVRTGVGRRSVYYMLGVGSVWSVHVLVAGVGWNKPMFPGSEGQRFPSRRILVTNLWHKSHGQPNSTYVNDPEVPLYNSAYCFQRGFIEPQRRWLAVLTCPPPPPPPFAATASYFLP